MNENRRYFDVNIIDILVLLVLVFSLFAGMYKGFLASGLSLLGMVGSWFGALRYTRMWRGWRWKTNR